MLSAFVIVLVVMAVFQVQSAGTAFADGDSRLVLQKPLGDACVRPADWMRRNHMDFLKHQRDLTVREGVRVREESLLNCKSCHTSREQFCDQCHTYVGVAPNCFTCHSYPK